MNKKAKDLFESDRRMELRLRLAIKRADESGRERAISLDSPLPPRELVDRLIDRVRRL